MNTGGQMKIWAAMMAIGFIGEARLLTVITTIHAVMRLMRHTSSAGARVNAWSVMKMETGSTRIVIPAMDATDGRGDGMAEILHVDEFEGKCGFAYRHEPFCNGGHNCRHPEAATEKIAGKEVERNIAASAKQKGLCRI